MDETIFRKESMDRISSPEVLNDYLRVTSPSVWLVLAAVILLLAGMLIWGAFAAVDSYVDGTAQVADGRMVLPLEGDFADRVEPGMTVSVGGSTARVESIGRAEDGSLFAVASTALADGSYPARVVYRQTQVLSFLFR